MTIQSKIHPAIASQHYRTLDLQSRVASAGPHGLVGLLYEELLRSLDLIIANQARGKVIAGNAHLTKSLSIIMALDSSLDFAKGGDLAPVLSRIYRSALRSLNDSARDGDISTVKDVRAAFSDIAFAWQALS